MEQFFNNPGFAHIADEIISHLDHRTLLRCRLVSFSIKKFVDNPKLWLRRCRHVTMSEENEAQWEKVIEILMDGRADVDQILDEVTLYLMKMSKSYYNVDSPIHYASKEGNLDLLKLTFESLKNEPEFQQNWQDFGAETNSLSPIHLAAKYGHLEVVKYLVEDMKFPTNFSWNLAPIYYAINEGHVEIVKYFLQKDLDNFTNVGLQNFAFQRGQLEVLKVLFDTFGVPNLSDLQTMCYEAFTLSINLSNYGSPTEESRPFKRIYDYLVRRFGLQIGDDHMNQNMQFDELAEE